MKFSLEKFSSHYRDILARAVALAMDESAREVEPRHLLISLVKQEGALAQQILRTHARDLQPRAYQPAPRTSELTPVLSESTIQIIDASARYAHDNDNQYIGTEHLLFALVHSPDQSVTELMRTWGCATDGIQEALVELFAQTHELHELIDPATLDDAPSADTMHWKKERPSVLSWCTKNLTAAAPTTHQHPVIGRDAEIRRVTEILVRKTKNNPILLGDPGVGKTAIVEALAQHIRQGTVAPHLAHTTVLELDLSALVAGTMYRGEFEGRLKELLEEIEDRDDIILFIDELHTIVGAGATHGSMDVANLLKPALARGKLRCIGATTYGEYKAHIEADPALARRFQAVHVTEPSREATKTIVTGALNHYERFHCVRVLPETIEATLELCATHLTNRSFPDKALDVLDEACSRVKLRHKRKHMVTHAHKLRQRIADIQEKSDELLYTEKIEQAHELLAEKKQHEEQLASTNDRLFEQSLNAGAHVTPRDVAHVVAQLTGIPITQLLRQEKTKLEQLERTLKKTIVGQEAALRGLSRSLIRSKLGLRTTSGPIASFVFTGPSGVGKTLTAKTLAHELYGTHDALIKLDMSEFSERHTLAKITGAPAGYVGYKEDTMLVRRLKQRSSAVVLFDEIEKAHPDVFNILLQVLDDGYLTDSSGQRVSLANTIIIMTTNIGGDATGAQLGFGTTSLEARDKHLRQFLRPELLNRMTKIIAFDHLSDTHLKDLVTHRMTQLKEHARNNNCTLR